MSICENINLYNEDCLKHLSLMEDNSVDLILTDPPYNIGKLSPGNIKLTGRSDINLDIADWDLLEFDPMAFASEFKRILKPNGNIFVFTSEKLLGKWHSAFGTKFEYFKFFVWHKTNPVPSVRKKGFLSACELVLCLWDRGHTFNFTKQNEMHNFFESPICMGKERLKDPKHPTQKPVKLLEHLIKIGSNEGDTVFDPFMGVGSTGVAALNNKRNFIGIELDKNYYEAAKNRLYECSENKKGK